MSLFVFLRCQFFHCRLAGTLFICLMAGASSNQAAAADNPPAVDLKNVAKHIEVLASDQFKGRGPLTEGEDLTIAYLSEAYRKMGLQPGNGDSYLQSVPMAQITPQPSMHLAVGNLTFNAGRDFTARSEQIQSQLALQNSPLVFVGYGINAPEYQWNDYAGADVEGKTVIVLVNDPGFATQDDNLFTGNAMTYYGRWTYKYEEAARQGAQAVFIVHETAAAAYPWSVVESSNTGSKYTLVDERQNRGKLPIMGWLQLAAAKQIFKQAGLDYQRLKQQALERNFKPVSLTQGASLQLNNTIKFAESHNVMGKIVGSRYPDEYVLIGAHWDHFGSKPGADGEIIYNGAVDNASGTAGTLELARMMIARHQQKPFARSLMFVNFTAEETGLLGSERFARGDIVATKNMVALLNIDGMNVLDATDYTLQYGKDLSQLEGYLARAAAKQHRRVVMDPRPQNGLFFRSDHFSLAKQGVPGLLFMSLGDTDPDYIAHRYHKGEDDFSAAWSLGGVEQDLLLMWDIAGQLANSRDWPAWTAESDFKQRRARDLKKPVTDTGS